MKGRKSRFLMGAALFVAVAIFALPVMAAGGEPGTDHSVAASQDQSATTHSRLDVTQQRALRPIEPGQIDTKAAKGWTKVYWRIPSFRCVSGSVVHIWINNKYMGYASYPGLWYVGMVKGGYKYRLYARDEYNYTHWGPKKYLINGSKFTWRTTCN